MPRYRLKHDSADVPGPDTVVWLKKGKAYHGIALLSFWDHPKVRLFHPEGEGMAEVPRESVEACS